MWSNITAAPFLLTGFPGLEAFHHWISIPFFAVYLCILLGSGTLLYLIKDDHSLHEPMYYFLAILAGTDVMVTLITMPTVMGTLWVNHREISHVGCFLQAYFIHSLSAVESGFLLAMVYDHFIAIRNPLRYTSILTNTKVVKLGVVTFLRVFKIILPVILRLFSFSYCKSHVITRASCLHQEVMKLACADIIFNRICPVIMIVLTIFLDSLIILFSYILIFKTVMSFASGKERAKALNTCISHVSCVLIFYVTVRGLTFIYRFGKHVQEVVHIIMSYINFLFPPLMNPLIYSIKTKQIQHGIVQLFSKHRLGC
ncbi:olfactory receptor 51B2-like [Carlito syrichta]|uniref:Olfactory receptor 51B2-like n=1 Tax=Carlito syrichta TaxID=1868482 RepID=A0A1U7TI66_CARSF|nr:olfactory receptor 51B2-like [Carlito syrichta]